MLILTKISILPAREILFPCWEAGSLYRVVYMTFEVWTKPEKSVFFPEPLRLARLSWHLDRLGQWFFVSEVSPIQPCEIFLGIDNCNVNAMNCFPMRSHTLNDQDNSFCVIRTIPSIGDKYSRLESQFSANFL